jgi:Fic family protein
MVNALLEQLRQEKKHGVKGGIYHKTQIAFAFDSNNIEGSRLTHEQTRMIYETKTVGGASGGAKLDDAIHADNHFRCFDFIIDNIETTLDENFIKELHRILKNGTLDSHLTWFRVGEWKTRPNEVGGKHTTAPKDVPAEIAKLLSWYNGIKKATFADICEFHFQFEKIHPFQDGNGRVGRLIMFRECLKHGHVPFIIEGAKKDYYYRGLREWENEKNFLIDTCLDAQDNYKSWLAYFEIPC